MTKPTMPEEITGREEALWQLLDDIDTGLDMFKPELTPYVRYVQRKVHLRFEQLTSDGYDLYIPGNEPKEKR